MNDKIQEFQKLITSSDKIVVIQADNPDADSLASALALETILGNMQKDVFLYCSLDMPEHLRYFSGWDRVSKEIPSQFDLTIIVDTSASSLLEKLDQSEFKPWVASKPVVVLDHHSDVKCDIEYANLVINDSSKVSTGELIFSLFDRNHVSVEAGEFIMSSILADSLGLVTDNTTSQTYRVMAELVDLGVNRPKLEELRRAYTKMPESIFRYKAKLISDTELLEDNMLAISVINQQEISQYSPLYNPNALIQNEHLQTTGVRVSIAIKNYDNGVITASIRCNNGFPYAAEIAQAFEGGGHAYAAGFKVKDIELAQVKERCIAKFKELNEGSK